MDYQAKPKVEYKYRVVELGTLKSASELEGATSDHIKPIAGYYPEYTTATDGSININNLIWNRISKLIFCLFKIST